MKHSMYPRNNACLNQDAPEGEGMPEAQAGAENTAAGDDTNEDNTPE